MDTIRLFHPTITLDQIFDLALDEDLATLGDVTTLATVDPLKVVQAHFKAKDNGIIAGIEIVEALFKKVDYEVMIQWNFKDGDQVKEGDIVGLVNGKAASILKTERTSLNIM